MSKKRTTLLSSWLLIGTLVLAACGDDPSTVSAAAGDDVPVTGTPAADDAADDDVSDGDDAPPSTTPATEDPSVDNDSANADADIIGTANLGGEVVDPEPFAINSIEILESYPESLSVNFTAGAEPCLAADVVVVGGPDVVTVHLDVGITTDALTKSCIAQAFDYTLNVPLSEGLDGREVVAALEAGGGDSGEAGDDSGDASSDEDEEISDPEPAPVDPQGADEFRLSLVGMSVDAAQSAAEAAGYPFRIIAIDGEEFAVTQDFIEDRINVKIVGGAVTETSLG